MSNAAHLASEGCELSPLELASNIRPESCGISNQPIQELLVRILTCTLAEEV
jgi:hypothetical protein